MLPETAVRKPLASWSRIHGLPHPHESKPNYGLTWREGNWWLVYYDKNGRSCTLSLRTEDLVLAKSRRDEYYRKVRTAGRFASSKMGFYAQKIVSDPSTNHGIKFMVCFANRKGVFDSLEMARKFRESVALELLEAEKAGRSVPKGLRLPHRSLRKIVTEGDFKRQTTLKQKMGGTGV